MLKSLLVSSALAMSAATFVNTGNFRDIGVSDCAEHYTGENCDVYKPTRHCADLKQFHGIDKSGYYKIVWKEKGYELEVYCDMETEDGGWTLMSSAESAEFANVTYAQYQKRFGGKGKSVDWLGLDNIAAMTQAVETSLRLDLHRCESTYRKHWAPLHALEIYDTFIVNSADKDYSLQVPYLSHGNDTKVMDNWIHWENNEQGPVFSAIDTDKTGCSQLMGRTGFWFSHGSEQNACVYANLNGVRRECTKKNPADAIMQNLSWGLIQLKQASMWLRPRHFLENSATSTQSGSL